MAAFSWKVLFLPLAFGVSLVIYLKFFTVSNAVNASSISATASPASPSPESDNSSISPDGQDELKAPVAISNTNISSTSADHVVDSQQYLDFVHEQCKRYNMNMYYKRERPRLMLLPKNYKHYKILYASNTKTGSTSFKKWYLRIQGSKKKYIDMVDVHVKTKYMPILQLMALYPDTPLSKLVEPYFKVGFVRNPLTRLISAFRDKFVRKAMYKHRLFKYDPSLTPESSDADKFRVFIDLVANGKIYDMHWNQQWSAMKICDWPYDLLGQTETTTQQMKIVQERTGTKEFEFPGSRSEQGQDSIATVQLAHEFYDGISQEIMEKIYKRYHWDFILMGYTKLDNPNFPYVDIINPLNASDLMGDQ